MTKRRPKPSTPEQARIAMREWERAQKNAEADKKRADYAAARENSIELAATLKNVPGIEVAVEKNGTLRRAQRLDFASLLLRREAISVPAFNAWRDFEELHATATGIRKGGGSYDRVDTTTIGQNITDAMVNASKKKEELLRVVGVSGARLLCSLLEGNASECGQWHITVERVTGEKNEDTHAALVRSACEGLAEAFRLAGYRRAA